MSLHNLISHGGRVLVVGGWDSDYEAFSSHPQLIFWAGDRSEIQRQVQGGFPDNVRGVVLSRFLGHSEGGTVITEARKRRALIIPTRDQGEIKRVLNEIVTAKPQPPLLPPPEPTETQSEQPQQQSLPPAETPMPMRTWNHGEQTKFVQQHLKAEGTHADEGRRLWKIAKEQGIKTTEASMAQAVYKLRTQLGVVTGKPARKPVERPAPAPAPVAVAAPRPKNNTASTSTSSMGILLKFLDDAQAAMDLLRGEVEKIKKREDAGDRLKEKLRHLLEED